MFGVTERIPLPNLEIFRGAFGVTVGRFGLEFSHEYFGHG